MPASCPGPSCRYDWCLAAYAQGQVYFEISEPQMPHLHRLLYEVAVTAHWVCWRHTHDLAVKLLYSYQFSPQSTYLNSLNSFFFTLVVLFLAFLWTLCAVCFWRSSLVEMSLGLDNSIENLCGIGALPIASPGQQRSPFPKSWIHSAMRLWLLALGAAIFLSTTSRWYA